MSLSLEDIWGGLLGIEHLILCADYAMWLAVEYDGRDEKTPIRIHCNLERERDKHINEFLADHRAELDRGECPNCGRQQRGIAPNKCPDCGVKRDDESYIREWAWKKLQFSVPGLHARCVVPAYLSNDLCGSYTANPSGDVDVPLVVARGSLLRHMTKLRKDYVRKCWDHLYISTSQDLIPNDSSSEAHQRYLANRQKLVNGYNWLTGIANQYPKFMEDYKAHTGICTFPPPIEMRGATVAEWLAEHLQAEGSKPQPFQDASDKAESTPPVKQEPAVNEEQNEENGKSTIRKSSRKGIGGRNRLNEEEEKRRKDIIDDWKRAHAAGTKRDVFCTDNKINKKELNKILAWDSARRSRENDN